MTQTSTNLSANQRALLKIRELKHQLAAARSTQHEAIAIVSAACRFPQQAHTPELFWESLLAEESQIREIPADRWDPSAFHDDDPNIPGKMYARHAACLTEIDALDAEFFGISPREATWVDPQQRLLLETGWEALERAGWSPNRVASRTGVFIGWMHNDYQNEASDSFLNLNPYIATGAAGSFLPGRLAYFLGLDGPSIAVDTACSSSLVALHLACQSLSLRECDQALVGGVNVIASPTTNILTCKLQALSPRGHSRAFDASADGYVRGEGCGVVTVKRLDDAVRDDDPILAVIEGSAVGHNGLSSGLTAPNPKAQERVIAEALHRAKRRPAEIGYLEAHGTGTELGDPIEMRAAAAALGKDRDPKNSPLWVASVKTNIGHLEAAAGMAGLIKVLLAMKHRAIPAHLGFESPNPHIDWDKIPVRIPTKTTPWETSGPLVAGVSAFGMSGTNAHAILSNFDNRETQRTTVAVSGNGQAASNGHAVGEEEIPELLPISGRSEAALDGHIANFASWLRDHPKTEPRDMARSLGAGRSHFEYRAAIVVRSQTEAAEKFAALDRGASTNAFRGHHRGTPKVAWQFTGQGSQYPGMARGLDETSAVFRECLDHCDAVLKPIRGRSLREVLFEDREAIHNTEWTQPCLFAVQMGLVHLLNDWGLQPDVVLGHSVGQYAAACTAGVLSWEEGLQLIAERGRLIGSLPAGGAMLAVFATEQHIAATKASFPGLSLAAENGSHIVISGPERDLADFSNQLKAQSIRSRALKTSHAFHSGLMDPILESFADFAKRFDFAHANIPMVCNVTGELLAVDQTLDSEYWAKHIREPVRYGSSLQSVLAEDCEVVLEVGPQPILSGMAKSLAGNSAALPCCLHRDTNDSESLLKAVAEFYVNGVTPKFERLQPAGHRGTITVLPTYPFQRTRFWGPPKPKAVHAVSHTAHPLLGEKCQLAGLSDETRYESILEPDSPAWLPDHEVMGGVVVPGAAFVEMARAAQPGHVLARLKFSQPLRPHGRVKMQSVVRSEDGAATSMEVFATPENDEAWQSHFQCEFSGDSPNPRDAVDRSATAERCSKSISPEDFYQSMDRLGLTYGPQFRVVTEVQAGEKELLARLELQADVQGFEIPPMLLDGALHSVAAGLLDDGSDDLFLPVGIERFVFHHPLESWLWSHATWRSLDGDQRAADIVLFDDAGKVLAEIEGFEVRRISRSAIRSINQSPSSKLLYQFQWRPLRLSGDTLESKTWLLVQPESTDCTAVVESLTSLGHQVQIASLPSGGQLSDRTVSDAINESSLDGVIWWVDSSRTERETLPWMRDQFSALLSLLGVFRERGLKHLPCGFQIVTENAVAVTGVEEESIDARHSAWWGLGRTFAAEHPEFRVRLIDRGDLADSEVSILTDYVLNETPENQIAIQRGKYWTARLSQVTSSKETEKFSPGGEGAVLITGGLGALGRHAARWLAEGGAKEVVLVSRRTPSEEVASELAELEETGCRVVMHSADSTSREDMETLFARFGNDLAPLRGVIHAAGVLDDALLPEQTWDRFERVLGPKVIGAILLDELTAHLPLEFFVLYSSAASVLGSPGQTNYATANGFLDGLAAHRRALGKPAISLNWGPWSGGMADDDIIRKRMALQGIAPLNPNEAHAVMESAITAGLGQTLVLDVDWQRLRRASGGHTPVLLEELMPTATKKRGGDSKLITELKALPESQHHAYLVTAVGREFQEILSTPDAPAVDRPLIEMGLDSLMAVEFSTRLQGLLGDEFAIAPTMLFDHPTIESIAGFIQEQLADAGTSPTISESDESKSASVNLTEHPQAATRDDIAIIGMSCRFPGANSVEEFWQNLLDGVDAVGEIPPDRWDIDRFYSAEYKPGTINTKQGGFLKDVAEFDAEFFGISAEEACWMDPQHRMLLENCWLALEDAGMCPQPTATPNVGIFMGIMSSDYAFLPTLENRALVESFQGAGFSHSAGVGRISHFFGFEGPSVSIDTASSSSLVAVIQAMRSLQDEHCDVALAGGVNAILAPANSLLMARAGLLAPDGRCKSFSASADGFGRGEGCGVVALKRKRDAERDGDQILAVLRGGAIAHNGTSGGITTPNGKSQSRLIKAALEDAKIAPKDVQYLEAHGTGTEYGDPIEINAASAVLGRGRSRKNPLLVGSVKANISHLEAAGGISGLIKSVLCLKHGLIPRQLHCEELSPHVPWKRLPVRMTTEQTEWPETEERIAAVTALGLSGTNAHIVLSHTVTNETQPAESSLDEESSALFLSAQSQAALQALLNRYRQFIEHHPDVPLRDVTRTACLGRKHFSHRVGLPITSRSHALEQLSAAMDQGEDSPFSNVCGTTPKTAFVFGTLSNAELLTFRKASRHLSEVRMALKSLAESQPDIHAWCSGDDAEIPRDAGQRDVLELIALVGIGRVLQGANVDADLVAGFGVGQYAAACFTGAISLEDAAKLLRKRAELQASEIDEAAFELFADTLDYFPPNRPLWCGLDAKMTPMQKLLGGSYWRRHAGESPKVSETMQSLTAESTELFLHVGEVSEQTPHTLAVMNTLTENGGNFSTLFAKLYTRGFRPNVLYGETPGKITRVPTYPFQRRRYWITDLTDSAHD